MLLYRTTEGIARRNGDLLDLIDTRHADIASLLAEGEEVARTAAVVKTIHLADAQLLAPVARRGRIILNGLNYVDHVDEGKMQRPDAPTFLDINDEGLSEPGVDILLPAEAATHVDFEGELVLIITKGGSNIPAEAAWDHIGALTIGNDVSARDVQMAGIENGIMVRLDQVRRGKTFPTFKPIGPAAFVPDERGGPLNLRLQTRVNGEVRQEALTSQMMFDIPTVIAHVSAQHELEVGDLIFTGTPSGVGLADGRYLRAGDVVEVTIDEIGTLRNRVVADDAS